MAKDVIDQLSLDIEVNVDKNIPKTISALASSIKELNSAVANVSGLQKYIRNLSKISASTSKVPRQTSIGQTVGVAKEDVDTGADKASQGFDELSSSAKEADKNVKNLSNNLKPLGKNAKKSGDDAKKSAGFWSKFVKSIGRIAMYRAIRGAIKAITSGLKEGLNNIRAVNEEFDKSVKNISLSGTSLKNSFAMMLTPIINSLSPLIVRFSDAIANAVNTFSEAIARLKGADHYTKILTSDTKEWQEQLKKAQGSLLSFDKFEALNNQQQYTGVVKVNIDKDATDNISNIMEGINQLRTTFERLQPFILGLVTAISMILTLKLALWFRDVASAGMMLVVGLGLLVVGILSLANAWKDMGKWQKIITIFVSLAGAIAAAAVALKIFQGNWVMALGIGAAVAGVGLLVGSKLSKLSANKFADGGRPEAGTLFYAGEAGAEVVYNSTRGGQTGVVNVEQISQAFLQALVSYNAAQNGNNKGGDVYLDSKKVGKIVTQSVYDEGVRVGYFKKS